MTRPRILFAGTPEISVPLLKALAQRFEVAGVLTSCDKSSGRSGRPVPSPVKSAALELGLPVLQFDSIRTEVQLRLDRGVTIGQLAKELKMHRNTLSRYLKE